MRKLRFVAILMVIALVATACVGASTDETTTTTGGDDPGQTTTTGGTQPPAGEQIAELLTYPDASLPLQFNPDSLPATFGEAPMLAEQVAAGTLPPVEERLPTNPPVVVGVDEAVGIYGDNILINIGSLGSWWLPGGQAMFADLVRQKGGSSGIFEADLAERWETNDDESEWTFYLREGLKWSDGMPFTTADIEFWYENVLLNEELVPSVPAYLSPGGEVAQLDVIDETTFKLTFAQPHPLFLLGVTEGSGMIVNVGFERWAVQPRHYMEQFLPGAEGLDAKIEAAGVASWPELFRLETDPNTASVGRPYMYAWTPDGPMPADGNWKLSRNPYYYKIDIAGNQLPYVDTWATKQVADKETLVLNTIAGEFDLVTVSLRGNNLPPIKEAIDNGAPIQMIEILNDKAGEVSIFMNYTVDEPVLREIFNDVRFRQAVSIAIDREEVSEARFRGFSSPGQASFPPTDELLFNEEWYTAFTEYDVAGANALLDEMGLTETDSDGFRLRPDGDRLSIIMDVRAGNHTAAVELIPSYMKDIGIDLQLKESASALFAEVTATNSVQWTSWSYQPNFFNPQTLIPGGYENSAGEINRSWGVAWSQWYYTDGAQGEEPPADVLRVMELVDLSQTAGSIEERVELLKEAGELHLKNLWVIGIAGMDVRPHIADIDLRNIPITGYGLNMPPAAHSQYPETWFYDR